LTAALWASTASAQPVEHTFIIVIDGLRASEAFDDPEYDVVGALVDGIVPVGALWTAMEVRDQTVTLPAHQVAVTGNYADYANLGAYEGRLHYAPRTPTLFDAWRRHTGAGPETCWVISNTYLVGEDANHTLMPGFPLDGGAGVITDYSYTETDGWVWDQVEGVLAEHEVDLMLVNLHETDREAHTENWETYTGRAREASEAIAAFWQRLQADPVYADTTALLVTTDHGRHLGGQEVGWRSHGCHCRGCRKVFLLAVGPGIEPGFASGEACSFLDIAPTVAYLMGLPFPYHRGRVLSEMLVDGDAVVPGPGGAFHPEVVAGGGMLARTWEWQDPTVPDAEGAHRVAVDLSTDDGETWATSIVEAGAAVQHAPVAWTDGEAVIAGWLEVLAGGDHWYVRLRRLPPGEASWQEVLYEPMDGASTPVGNLALVHDPDEGTLHLLENNALSQVIRVWSSDDDGATWSSEPESWAADRYFPRDLRHVTVGDTWVAVFSAHATGPPGQLDPNDNTEIYRIRSDDQGGNWETGIEISDSETPSIAPAMVVDGAGVIHVIWSDRADGTFQLHHASSTDDGSTFSAPVQLTAGSMGAWEPVVAVDGERSYVAWSQYDAEDHATVRVAALEGDLLVEEQVFGEVGQVARTPALLPLGDCTSLLTWTWSDLEGPWELAEERVTTAGLSVSMATGTVTPDELEAGGAAELEVHVTLLFEDGDRGVDVLGITVPDGLQLTGTAGVEVAGGPLDTQVGGNLEQLTLTLTEPIGGDAPGFVLRLGVTSAGQQGGGGPLEVLLGHGAEPCTTAVEGALAVVVLGAEGDDDDTAPGADDDCSCSETRRPAPGGALMLALVAAAFVARRTSRDRAGPV